MCGIAGFSGEFSKELLVRMGKVIQHRGPDDQGIFYDQKSGIGLAHQRLSIIDLSSAGRQPMWDTKNKVIICFNGEIYNYRELRSTLVSQGYIFTGNSDTEVLLNLYLRDGESMLDKLNGIYAFALWEPDNQTLFLARDGIGVKPLYYHEGRKGFLFSSEIKSLIQEKSLDLSISPEAVNYHMSCLWCPSPLTMFNEVKKMEPGMAMRVQYGKISQQWYFYDIPYGQSILSISENEAAILVSEQVSKAVERQMVSDVPVGAFLSGGLDSSSVVAFAKRHSLGQKLQCFTIGFDKKAAGQENFGLDHDYAVQVAKHLGVDLHTVHVGPDIVDHLEKTIYSLDEPQADPAPINTFLICNLARQRGIKVLLSGAGGDDIFTGYRRHYALNQERFWSGLPRWARSLLKNTTSMFPQESSFGRRLTKAFQYGNLDEKSRLCSYFLWNDQKVLNSMYGPYMSSHLENLDSIKFLKNDLMRLPSNVAPLNQMLYLETKRFLADHNLNYTDKMSMATSVEVRVPLLDSDLVSLAARIPPIMKQRGRIGKWIFKKSMEPYLPNDVIYRPKVGFGVPLRHWMKRELRPMVEELLSESSLKNRGLFDPTGVAKLRSADVKGQLDGTYTLYAMLCMEVWCRQFIDGVTP